MNPNRQFDNEHLRSKANYLLWLLFILILIFLFQLVNPLIKPNRYSGSILEWIFSIFVALIVVSYFIFHRRFVSLIFDDLDGKITLKTMTIVNGLKIENYTYSSISYTIGKTLPNLRKRQTSFIEIFSNRKKIFKIERSSIGESSFDLMLIEFEKLKNNN